MGLFFLLLLSLPVPLLLSHYNDYTATAAVNVTEAQVLSGGAIVTIIHRCFRQTSLAHPRSVVLLYINLAHRYACFPHFTLTGWSSLRARVLIHYTSLKTSFSIKVFCADVYIKCKEE